MQTEFGPTTSTLNPTSELTPRGNPTDFTGNQAHISPASDYKGALTSSGTGGLSSLSNLGKLAKDNWKALAGIAAIGLLSAPKPTVSGSGQKQGYIRPASYDPYSGKYTYYDPIKTQDYTRAKNGGLMSLANGGAVAFADGGPTDGLDEDQLRSVAAYLATNPSPEDLAAAQQQFGVSDAGVEQARQMAGMASAVAGIDSPANPVDTGGLASLAPEQPQVNAFAPAEQDPTALAALAANAQQITAPINATNFAGAARTPTGGLDALDKAQSAITGTETAPVFKPVETVTKAPVVDTPKVAGIQDTPDNYKRPGATDEEVASGKYSRKYSGDELATISGTFDQYRNDPAKLMELMDKYGVSVNDLAMARSGNASPDTLRGYDNIFLQAGAKEGWGGMYTAKDLSSDDKAFIDWKMAQPNGSGGTLADTYKAQGITNFYGDARLIADAKEQNARADRRLEMYKESGQPAPALYDRSGTSAGIKAWANPNWKEDMAAAAERLRVRQAAGTAQDIRNGVVLGGGNATPPGGTPTNPTNPTNPSIPTNGTGGPGTATQTPTGWTPTPAPGTRVPTSIEDFNNRFNTQTGDSAAQYNYLMGNGPEPKQTQNTELMRPYWESMGTVPVDKTRSEFIYDNTTKKYIKNPDYVRKIMDPVTKRLVPENTATDNKDKKPTTPPDSGMEWVWDDTKKQWLQQVIGSANGGLMHLYAAGGLGSLGGYSDGGQLLRGGGDGVSDSIPASIGGRQPARLADGEFVVPARIVSELGNGSTEAGARRLYQMMDRVQNARKKSIGKNKVATNSRADKYLPA